ncbi:MAG TPA: glycerol-3-phosphate dehydrogenase/oxidase [Terriglobia bacterium]|nr:glycerol-3-phosphate dehydrogenase/oxidase [Terriglobia bacterium]
MKSRAELLQSLGGEKLPDILIVGGGINAAGLYRDLAAQGVPALLVEKGDFCSGTSAAPSRLIHGGLRYLETGEFTLVRESVEERNLLLHNAPHYVRPLPVWVPVTSWWDGFLMAGARFLRLTRTPGPRGALVLKLGLTVYDWFGAKYRSMPKHRMIGGKDALRQMPGLLPATCSVGEFYDARLTNAERLTLELVADAERDCAASFAIPYLAVAGHDGKGVLLRDEIDGTVHRVAPRIVINAAGAWIDRVDAHLGIEERLVGGTKGSHLVLDHAELAQALGEKMIYFPTSDHRICLAYPLDETLVLVGTTDLPTEDPEDMTCSEAEIDYLFRVMTEIMPGIRLNRSQIVFRYAGVRPLPKATSGTVAGAISRDHHVRLFERTDQRPYDVLTLVGGKWTTYRACAEQIADQVLARIGKRRRIDTKSLKIGGGARWPREPAKQRQHIAEIARQSGLTLEHCTALADRYGAYAATIAAAVVADGTDTDRPLKTSPDYSRGEIRHLIRAERTTRLADLVLRRTQLGLLGKATPELLGELADLMGQDLSWSEDRRSREIAEATRLLQQRHGAASLHKQAEQGRAGVGQSVS